MQPVQYEYVVIRLGEGRATHLADRINDHAAEGYEPFMMCGDTFLTVLLRRPKTAESPASAAPAE
ncbi:MAG: hypothetical protein ACUVX8_15445 [Candidatus Zipacnadales bacterium]